MSDWLMRGLYHTALILGGLVVGFIFLGLMLWRVGRDPLAGRYDPIAIFAVIGIILTTSVVFGFW